MLAPASISGSWIVTDFSYRLGGLVACAAGKCPGECSPGDQVGTKGKDQDTEDNAADTPCQIAAPALTYRAFLLFIHASQSIWRPWHPAIIRGMATALESQETTTLDQLGEKLDRLLAFQEQLAPYLPLLGKLSAMLDNPAARFRDIARLKKGVKANGAEG